MQVYSYFDGEYTRSMIVLSGNQRFFSDYSRGEIEDFMSRFSVNKGIVSELYPSGDMIQVAHQFNLDEVEPVRSVYMIDRAYGGPEEGGWYYNQYSLFRVLGEGEEYEEPKQSWYSGDTREVLIVELYEGQNITTNRPTYS